MCAADPSLRAEVEALLAADDEAGEFGESAPLSAPEAAPTLAPGTTLGPYCIESLIGSGGMGEVYQARDARLGRRVAIKILAGTARRDAERRQRLAREARAISTLNHPHICTLYDIGEHDGFTYLVMELLEGETLAARLSRGALPVDTALPYAMQIASALERAHQSGIIHRDLKPRNVMLATDGAKLLDFGVAKLRADTGGKGAPASRAATSTAEGIIVGTLPYMAPEQVEGGDVDARTDIFAFGAVLYEMLTGAAAFQGDSQAALITAILRDDPPSITVQQPLVPASLERVVRTCLAKRADDRWQSAGDLVRELQRVLDDGRVAAGRAGSDGAASPLDSLGVDRLDVRSRTPVTGGRGHRVAWTAAAAALIAVMAGVAVSWRPLADRLAGRAGAGTPAVLALLPHANPDGDLVAEHFGRSVMSLVGRNVRAAQGLNVVTRETTAQYATARTDLEPLRRDVGADYVFDMTVRRAAPAFAVLVRLRRPGAGARNGKRTSPEIPWRCRRTCWRNSKLCCDKRVSARVRPRRRPRW